MSNPLNFLNLNRAGWHRVQLYKLLVAMDFHVITMDYRGKDFDAVVW